MSEDTFASTVGAVVVTTPQAVSVHDVQREINFCQKCQLHVLGTASSVFSIPFDILMIHINYINF